MKEVSDEEIGDRSHRRDRTEQTQARRAFNIQVGQMISNIYTVYFASGLKVTCLLVAGLLVVDLR